MASFSVPCPKTVAVFAPAASSKSAPGLRPGSVAFGSVPKLNHALVAGFQASNRNQSDIFRVCAQVSEVALEAPSNSAPIPEKPEESTEKSSAENTIPDASTLNAFMTQVADLVKLVDSRDIMELQLKQLDCEVLIRKKEALPQPPAAPMFMAQPPSPQFMVQSQMPSAQASPAPAPVPAPAAVPAAKPKSSHPPLKCPMAGTFYRSPAPGAPAFVKVGDKVQKGQVVCIIEAMKLMNEIEADTSGTIVDILAEDGKPVSLDTPLLVIAP